MRIGGDVFRRSSLSHLAAGLLVLPVLIATSTASTFAQPSMGSTATTQPPSEQALKDWQRSMRRVPFPKQGCFTSSYPSTQWQEVPCTTAPAVPYPPARGPRTNVIGNGNDVSASVTGLISETIGSFDNVTGVTSESGTGPYAGSNSFSLQLNSNFFGGSPTCNGAANPASCLAWQQFVYANASCPHCAFMQYWLINYNRRCPGGWFTSSGPGFIDCYKNSTAVNVPSQSITNLITLSVTGQAVSGGNDTMTVSVGATIYSVTGADSVVYLANGWTESEFNIVGDCCGSQANFNSGSTIVVRTSVNYGSRNAPSCAAEGFTGETNNLNFGTAPAISQESEFPAVVFTESTSGSAPSPCASATEIGASEIGASNLASTHDFNGDGTSDVLWRDTAGDVGLWLMKGTQILQGAAFSSVPLNWSIVGQRDFNGDGKADILWRDTAGDVGLWLMNGTQIVQGGAFSAVPLNWSIAGTGDFNGDGKADILWLDNQNNVGIWFMNGTQILQGGVVGQLPANWTVVGSDMRGDIFLRNISTGELAMWVMKGTQIAQNVDLGPLPATWSVAGIGDFDGNGSFDILLRDTSGNVQVWLMSGTQVLSKTVLGNVPTGWSIAETGDFNGDGKSDILWVDNVGDVGVWFMNGTTILQGYVFGNVGTAWTVQSLNAD